MLSNSSLWASWIFAAGMCVALALALALRLPELERRPMHGDEAVQAVKTGVLFETGNYAYDPHEFHGPTLYYFTLPVLWLARVKTFAASTEFDYRIVPVILGVALLLLHLLIADAIGRSAVFCASVLAAVSPAMVFYSRYYIQEMPLVFFSFAVIASGWRYFKTRSVYWALLTGVSIGLTHATKETCAIVFFAMAAALAILWLKGTREERPTIPRRHAAIALGAAAFVSILFFSSFFTHARGPLDSLLTFGNYFERSHAANFHDKPWNYYLRLLVWNHAPGAPIWTEAFTVALALFGAALAFTKSQKECGAFARFVAIYTFAMLAVYSVISYKTPWCVLGALHGLILLAGIGAARIFELLPHWSLKTFSALCFAAGASHLAWQAVQADGRFNADPRNPYVYVHPTVDVARLCERIEALAALHADRAKIKVSVMAPGADYWPIPWYLRRLSKVGYTSAPPAQIDAPVIVAAPEFADELTLEIKHGYQKNLYGLRPGVKLMLYVDDDLWRRFLAARQNGTRK